DVTVVSPARQSAFSADLEARGLRTVSCGPNDSAQFARLAGSNPDLVLFDRFVMEEQFGWRCREAWPRAVQWIDTQDLHSVRRFRERVVREGGELRGDPAPEDLGEDLLRELSALLRVDDAFVVSAWEREWLLRHCPPL